ncbi:uncharacterized protein LOC130719415 [Lotus japonicus]|uniref:uncharacterized protein LOC130719415 n=1 Tax=Lotus japonicus TaxID=34305 RepID=UPI00258A8281|nr:uncharacterized protein LOC130719415 [Lotus japonicus]
MGMMAVPASGATGGLATLWRVGFLEVLNSISDPRFLILFVKLTGIDVLIMLVNVCGPHLGEEKMIMYDELLGIMRRHEGGIVLGGDFNTVLNDGERKNANGVGEGDRAFKDFVYDACVMDFPLQNAKFTWFSSRNSGLWSRLDRWLVTEDFLMLASNVSQSVLEWSCSDHRAVAISFGNRDYGPKPFYFFNHWVLEDGFKEMVADWWDSSLIEGWSGYVLMSKLKGFRGQICEWRRKKGPWGVVKIKVLEESLNDVIRRMECEGVSEELRYERLRILDDLWGEYRAEERSWLAKSRVRWLKEGDRNSRFFHKVSKAKVAKKHISQLEYEGQVLEDPTEIKNAVKQHFQSFFKQDTCVRPVLHNRGIKKVSAAM